MCKIQWNATKKAILLTLQASTPHTGQAHSNNSSGKPASCLSVFDHFVGLAFKVLNLF